MGQTAIELRDVSHVYVSEKRAALVIERLNMTIGRGQFVSLVGPSGCGKTTVLSIIAGLIRPAVGEALVDHRLVDGPSPSVGYMLQQDYLLPWKTIYDNVVIGLKLRRMMTEDNERYARHLLEEVGLWQTRQLYPHQLSGGMRQRAALARTLVSRPDILLLDEPFSALDYLTKLQLEHLVAAMLRQHGITALLVTHDLTEAIAMSDSIMLMRKHPGRIDRVLEVPDHLRAALPVDARSLPGFKQLFDEMWQWFGSFEEEGDSDG